MTYETMSDEELIQTLRDGDGKVIDYIIEKYKELVRKKAGSMFSDADLLGIPLRLVISPKTLADGEVEFRTRACRDSRRIKIGSAAEELAGRVREELAKFAL